MQPQAAAGTGRGTPRRPTSPVAALVDGWRRVLRAPVVAAAVLAGTVLLALPAAPALRPSAGGAPPGWIGAWSVDFTEQAGRLGAAFTHELFGIGGATAAIGDLVASGSRGPAAVGAVAAYAGLWIFLSGGVLDRYARGRPVRAAAFFAACGVFFVRFLRLLVLMLAAYGLFCGVVHPLVDRLAGGATTTHEVLSGLVAALVAATGLVFDYAQVRTVVEDRRSVVAAVAAGFRFVRRRIWRTAALYLIDVFVFLAIGRLWTVVAPPAGAPAVWTAVAIAAFLLARTLAKLAVLATEVAFFQSELAHAGYTAAPPLVWPESAAAEAIRHFAEKTPHVPD